MGSVFGQTTPNSVGTFARAQVVQGFTPFRLRFLSFSTHFLIFIFLFLFLFFSPTIVSHGVHLRPRLQQIPRYDREAHRRRPVQRGVVEEIPFLHAAAPLHVHPHALQISGLRTTDHVAICILVGGYTRYLAHIDRSAPHFTNSSGADRSLICKICAIYSASWLAVGIICMTQLLRACLLGRTFEKKNEKKTAVRSKVIFASITRVILRSCCSGVSRF